jgi:endonuclease III
MSTPNIRTKRKVARALRAYSRKMGDWVRPIDNTRKLRPNTANAFLLGVMFDRSIKWQLAWEAGKWINLLLGDDSDPTVLWQRLADMEPKRLRAFLRYGNGGKAFHRHWKTFARLLPEAAQHILDNYGGDPRRIWNSQRDVRAVQGRLDEIPTIGQGLANMAVSILALTYGLLGGRAALPHLDVKPDVHVKRVFRRAGLVDQRASDTAVIEAARLLAADWPAALDSPAWDIGMKWCRPSRPNCGECPIGAACPKLLGATRP